MITSRGRIRISLGAIVMLGLVLGAAAAFADPPPGYYDSVDTTDALSLRITLHDVIDDHIRFPYTSSATDTWDILELADEDPTNSGNILDVYKNASYAKAGGGNTNYNREHTWPKSYGFPNDNSSNYAYTDCHMLFLCDSGYNSSRSNKPYRYCSASCSEKITDVNGGAGGGSGVYPGNSSWTEGSNETGTWETWIDRRGDVARALFYMDLRYEGGTHGSTGADEPDLILTDNQSLIIADAANNQSVAYMGLLSDLIFWHLEDPVDDRERARNDIVGSFQGNRNPFIDHPEWVDCLYGGGACQTTGGNDPWINEFHYDNASTDVGEFVEIAGPAGTDLTGWSVVGYNGGNGATYKTVALSGVLSDQGGCLGAASFAFSSMQNGAPDGLALLDPTDRVVEFLSYEGAFTAASGPAAGMTSVDISVSETGSTPAGHSLQRIGSGATAADFAWQAPALDSPGAVNAGQVFMACDATPPAPPTGLAATGGNGFVDLDWSDSNESDLDGYNVYRSTGMGGPYSPLNITIVGASAYTDTTVTNGITYYYVVTAVDLSGNESADSSEANATPDAGGGGGGDVFINEFHYDNAGTDVGEFVEIAGPAGTDLAGWQVIAYNGNGGSSYKSITLSDIIADEGGCMGTLSFSFSSMQNGAPDGLALVDPSGVAVEFISYEGSFTATGGPADGMTSVDIGVAETTSTPVGYSLQRTGTGSAASDFSWVSPSPDSPGTINAGQTFDGCGGGGGGDTTPPAVPVGLTGSSGNGFVDLAWNDNGEPDLDGYNVYRSTASGGPYTKINASLLSASGFTDNAVVNGTTYFYVATAVDLSGNESGNSSEVAATPEAPTGPTILTFDDFENSFGNYTDGGSDCKRYTGGTHAYQGNAAANIQDNSGTKSSFYLTNGVDVDGPGYSRIDIHFFFKAVSMDNSNEDFWVEYYDGSSWQTVATFARGIDFDNDVFYETTVTILESSYIFPSDMKVRFRCDASGNADDVYIDSITVSAE